VPLIALALSGLLCVVSPVLAAPASETVAIVVQPGDGGRPSSGPGERWVAPHVEAPLWSGSGTRAEAVGVAHLWSPLRVLGGARGGRLPVWDPSTQRRVWIPAFAVGPVNPMLAGSAYLPPIGQPIAWSGSATVTMYTCVELGGCAPTASGIWPEPGVVAVDPTVIPLGSMVWIQGLGTFLAADTGSLVRGAHLDVFGWDYDEAIAWGVQQRAVLVFAPGDQR
jgi:3D (Asp-Asp-Asp) domain-containing protein